MKKKIWFYLCIVQALVILIAVVIYLCSTIITPKVRKVDLSEYLLPDIHGDNSPNVGYISNARTAKIIGESIIDDLIDYGHFIISGTSVGYDEENRLWWIGKGYLFKHGGIVVIEQDTGKIVKFHLTK